MRNCLPRSLDLGVLVCVLFFFFFFLWPSKKRFPFLSCWHLLAWIQSFPKEWRNAADKSLTTLCSHRQRQKLASSSPLWHFGGGPLFVTCSGYLSSGTVDQRKWKKRSDVINSSWYLETKGIHSF